MSSNYSYKGVPLNQIYDSSGISTVNQTYQGYIGFPLPKSSTYNLYNYLRPRSFGYSGPSGDLRNYVDASNTGIITTSQNISIPQNCKAINVIAVGGGGGGGGAGGKVKADPANAGVDYGWGGSGGSGGYAKYDVSNNVTVSSSDIINVVIGSGGDGGTSSREEREFKANYNNISGWNSPEGYASDGTNGKSGGSTTIKIGNTILNASGGNGGNYGTGAYGYAANSKSKVLDGVAGNSGNSIDTTYNGDLNMTYPNLSTFGNPGNGGIDSNIPVNGQPGTRGAVQIIWLYD